MGDENKCHSKSQEKFVQTEIQERMEAMHTSSGLGTKSFVVVRWQEGR